LPNVGRDGRLAGLLVRVEAVEAVGQPVVGPVVKDDDLGKLNAGLDRLGVVAHRLVVDFDS